jgi:pimeloyl-ACP methyl ester carboxylesterase
VAGALAVTVAGVVVTAGVSQAVDQASAPGASASGDPLAAYRRQPVTWGECTGDNLPTITGLQCAAITAPLDYRDPAGPTITVAVSRIAASRPDKRRGVLLSNPGGPGAPGRDMPKVLRDVLPAEVHEQYDLIGIDPRGTGGSSPLQCHLSGEQWRFADTLAYPYDPVTFEDIAARSRDVADTCARNIGPRMAHFTTANTARDIDLLRGVLGEEKISYIGVSYGTYLGAVYATLFPERADRIVLDSSTEPDWDGSYHLLSEAAPAALQRWATWTAAHDDLYHLGRTPADVTKTFFDMIRSLEDRPLERLDPGKARWWLRRTMYNLKQGAEYVVNLRETMRTSKPATGPGPKATVDPPTDEDDAFGSLTMAVVCGDAGRWSHDVEQYRREAESARKKEPLIGDLVHNVNACAFWTNPSAEPAVKVYTPAGALIVQNEWDPNTPLEGAQQMHRVLPGSRLLTVINGQGHGVLHRKPGACVVDHVGAYLSTGQLPAKDVTCQLPAPTP